MTDETDVNEVEGVQDDNESLLVKITKSLQNLVTLEIKTMVGQMTFDQGGAPIFPAEPKSMYSRIDLLQGDITTIYDPEFITGELTSLREFHQNREKQGQEIIQGNIKTLRDLVKLIKDENLKE